MYANTNTQTHMNTNTNTNADTYEHKHIKIHRAKQVLAKYNIDPEKIEIIEIDGRKDMDQIQAYMKKVGI